VNRLALLRALLRYSSSLGPLVSYATAIYSSPNWAGRIEPQYELTKIAYPILDELHEELSKVSVLSIEHQAVAVTEAEDGLRVAAVGAGVDFEKIINTLLPLLIQLYQLWQSKKG